jgi:hypothetical protein
MSWRRFLTTFVATALLGAAGLLALVVLIDPYGTGRLTPITSPRVPPLIERYATPSLGRNPAFDSAIFGNSTAELLSPVELDRRLGGRFVQLFVKGTGPEEQLVVIDWFRRHHPEGTRFLVFGIDTYWCDRNHAIPVPTPPFPYWLYGPDADYLRGLISYRALGTSFRRVGVLLGRGKTLRADGFVDYELSQPYDGDAALQRVLGKAEEFRAIDARLSPDTPAPAMPQFGALGDEIRRFPAGTRSFLVFMPLNAHLLPPPGSARATELAACKAAARRMAETMPGIVVLDRWQAGPETLDDKLWWDGAHFRGAVARIIEAMIDDANMALSTARR